MFLEEHKTNIISKNFDIINFVVSLTALLSDELVLRGYLVIPDLKISK